MVNYDLITILGPTASGKTPLAVALAYKLDTEIISGDSRQIYRRMDLGTGKDLADYVVNGHQVPYHLIDIVDPGCSCGMTTATDWATACPTVPPTQLPLWSGRPPRLTKKPLPPLMEKAASLKGSAPVTRSGCSGSAPLQMGCPGSQADTLHQGTDTAAPMRSAPASRLMQWPVQIKLLPVQAPFYQGARLLIAADCTAFSRADFHERFMKGRITLIGCPKLDEGDYAEKLTEIIRCNDIREVTIVRMEVPCCGGLQRAAETALRESGKFLPWQVVTLGRDGTIQE